MGEKPNKFGWRHFILGNKVIFFSYLKKNKTKLRSRGIPTLDVGISKREKAQDEYASRTYTSKNKIKIGGTSGPILQRVANGVT